MDPVSFGFGVVQVLDLSLKYGKILIESYLAYRHSNERIAALVTRIKRVWVKTETQIRLLRRVVGLLEESLLSLHEELLFELYKRLHVATLEVLHLTGSPNQANLTAALENLAIAPSTLKRAKYSAFEKSIQQLVFDLETWQARFDPSWYILTLIADRTIDAAVSSATASGQDGKEVTNLQRIRGAMHQGSDKAAVAESVFRSPDFVASDRRALPGCSCYIGRTKSGEVVVIDSTARGTDKDLRLATVHICDLAKLLATSSPSTLGLLTCLGVIRSKKDGGGIMQYDFIFSIPPHIDQPSTLRMLLLKQDISLNGRFELAKSLSKSVMSVHNAGFVHKNIRPETSLVVQAGKSDPLSAFLIGFERFRPAHAQTVFPGDQLWERNLYRHPERQGLVPDEYYTMQHDIYSLGVCLLEIGLWMPFVLRVQDDQEPMPQQDESTSTASPNVALKIEGALMLKNKQKAAVEIKARLIELAEIMLPSRMGDRFSRLVKGCLTCLDGSKGNLFDEEADLEDENGIVIGVAFIRKILLELEDISL